jgi:hypothetical protein
MEIIQQNIEKDFRSLLVSKGYHIFIKDIQRTEKFNEDNTSDRKGSSKIEYIPQIDIQIKNSNISKSSKQVLSKEKIEEILRLLNVNTPWKKIEAKLNRLERYNLPSTITDLKGYLKSVKNDNRLNIMIVGAGPMGLFLANYIHEYYNRSNILRTRVNILVIENRIEKELRGKPYSRNRRFCFGSKYLSIIFKKMFCYNRNYNSHCVSIKHLENMLYIKAYFNKIPIYYTKKYEKWKDLLKIAKNRFNFIFDCTGGRLHPNIIKPDAKWLNDLDIVKETKNYEIIAYPKQNIVKVNYKKMFPKYLYYSNIEFYNRNKKYITSDLYNITDLETLGYLEKFNGLTVKKNIFSSLIRGIKDDTLRNRYGRLSSKIYTVKLSLFTPNIRHVLQVSKIINKDLMYIGLGDTIFHSHFETGSGLNRLMGFAVRIVGLLEIASS